jgi:hypothetical protein
VHPYLDGMLKRLQLPTVRRLYPELARRAEGEGMTCQTFLELLIVEDIAHPGPSRRVIALREEDRTRITDGIVRVAGNGLKVLTVCICG